MCKDHPHLFQAIWRMLARKMVVHQILQQHVTNLSDANDFAFSIDCVKRVSRIFSQSDYILLLTAAVLICRSHQIPKTSCRKKVKSASHRINWKNRIMCSTEIFRTATIDNFTLMWPPYGIKNAVYANEYFSIINTCPIDTGLFVLYYAYRLVAMLFVIFSNLMLLKYMDFFVLHLNWLKVMVGLLLVSISLLEKIFLGRKIEKENMISKIQLTKLVFQFTKTV